MEEEDDDEEVDASNEKWAFVAVTRVTEVMVQSLRLGERMLIMTQQRDS